MYRLKGIILRLIPKAYFLKKIDKIINDEGHSNLLVSYSGVYSFAKESHNCNEFKEYIKKEFEGKEFMVIKDYDSYLKDMYGNYMELPPESERVFSHYVSRIEIDDYKKSNKCL